jgi:hypothetical protein
MAARGRDGEPWDPMAAALSPDLIAGSLVGLGAGLVLLVRGMGGYRTAVRISDTPGSPIASLAVGEVRITGLVEPAELLLTSPLTSRPCVYYRADVREDEGRTQARLYSDQRAVGFRLRDPSGDVRVFPRGARFDVPFVFEGHSGLTGDPPAGLQFRSGPVMQQGQPDRDEQIAALLTVHDPADQLGSPLLSLSRGMHGRRMYREARLEPGDTITLVGFVEPFDQLPDPDGADRPAGLDGDEVLADPAVAADIAEARATGRLAANPADAWGNAAIEGFGIERPVRPAHLDPDAHPMPVADPETARRFERTFAIAPEALIVASTRDVPLLITAGVAAVAATRQDHRFVVGLFGAVLSIGSAMLLALIASGSVAV